jgi:hypothetical protein
MPYFLPELKAPIPVGFLERAIGQFSQSCWYRANLYTLVYVRMGPGRLGEGERDGGGERKHESC